MSITLGGVNLSDEIVWTDRDTYNATEQSVRYTLQGTPLLFSQTLSRRYITLVADETRGWLTKAEVDALYALAEVKGATYTLNLSVRMMTPENYTVIFRHFEPPALAFTPFVFRHDQQSGEYYSGTIKLMTVN